MRKLLAVVLCTVCIDVAACTVSFNTADAVVTKVVRANGWGFKDYEAICRKLQKADVELLVTGDATVLSGRSIAWASVGLKDRNGHISTFSFGGSSTRVNERPGSDIAEEILMEAINSAVDFMTIDKGIGALNEARGAATRRSAANDGT